MFDNFHFKNVRRFLVLKMFDNFQFLKMFDVSGRRAVITGGAQGFGRQFARRLLQGPIL
jgi:hypothetical protein